MVLLGRETKGGAEYSGKFTLAEYEIRGMCSGEPVNAPNLRIHCLYVKASTLPVLFQPRRMGLKKIEL
jgi:hypothetical protein